MAKRYWLHRISHEWELSYSLLDIGYLSIGWRYLLDSDLLERIRTGGESGFNAFMAEWQVTGRSRWNLWRMSQFQPGDIVVVPLFDKSFTIVVVEEPIISVDKLSGTEITSQTGELLRAGKDGIRGASTDKLYDIGFLVKVKPLREPAPRIYASAPLIRKMKLRQNNAEITGIADDVESAIAAKGPINLHDKLVDAIAKNVREVMLQYITDTDLEKLVRWYMLKKGASSAWIPSKNESGKEDGADADVVAEFEALHVIYYIQVKCHEGLTGDWAVQQISRYKEQKQDTNNDYTYISWAVTTAEFDGVSIERAQREGVRLVGGSEFIRMLLDVGFEGIESAGLNRQ